MTASTQPAAPVDADGIHDRPSDQSRRNSTAGTSTGDVVASLLGPAPDYRTRTATRSTRGQTEPLAALVAVAVVCLAISMHAGFLTGLIPQFGDDRSLGDATAERVWGAISEDGIYDSGTRLAARVEPETLPEGAYVDVNVTYVGDGGWLESAGNATFGPHGDPVQLEPPATAERRERVLPIRFGPGEIRPGTLRVVIWS